MLVSGRVKDEDKRYDVRVVHRDKFIGIFILVKMLELVDDDVHCASSRVLIQLFMEP